MKIIGMIPARGGSSRFNMKPLAEICGKPMLYWVWKHSKEVECFEEVYVATDNELIKETAEGFGAKVIMTSPDCETATERLYEVSHKVEADNIKQISISKDSKLMTTSRKLRKELRLYLNEYKNLLQISVKHDRALYEAAYPQSMKLLEILSAVKRKLSGS